MTFAYNYNDGWKKFAKENFANLVKSRTLNLAKFSRYTVQCRQLAAPCAQNVVQSPPPNESNILVHQNFTPWPKWTAGQFIHTLLALPATLCTKWGSLRLTPIIPSWISSVRCSTEWDHWCVFNVAGSTHYS